MTDMPKAANPIEDATTRGGLPVSPSMGPVLQGERLAAHPPLVDRRVVLTCFIAVLLAAAAAVIAEGLVRLIYLISNAAFYGERSTDIKPPAGTHLGIFIIIIPAIGGIIVGLMARYGAEGIRGHGIPEAMHQVLIGKSKIPARLTFLKPLSAAVAIGTGGPFGAEGPIIATGGALGSVIGQFMRTTAAERKVLLASGAAAGMAATFGSPVSAALLSIELLLFEFRPRSFIPVALASTTAAGLRFLFHMPYPLFDMPVIGQSAEMSLLAYIVIGAIVGVASVWVTWAVYAVEDAFALLPIHWMWWPALGGLAVGVIGYFRPDTLGVGYENISKALSLKDITLASLACLCVLKFVSWSVALGSGTSGGTLAPLFTIGGALGCLLGAAAAKLLPGWHIDIHVAALVGMAALFAGASRALLTSVVFAFETTLQPMGLLPLLGGCAAAYFVSCALMQNTIMTAKITRHGVRVPAEFVADFLDQLLVKQVMTTKVLTLRSSQTLAEARQWISRPTPESAHQGFPVVDDKGRLLGLLTRRDLLNDAHDAGTKLAQVIHHPPRVTFPEASLREAADEMVDREVGRLCVVEPDDRNKLVGIITRSDILSAHRARLSEVTDAERSISLDLSRNPRWRRIRRQLRRLGR